MAASLFRAGKSTSPPSQSQVSNASSSSYRFLTQEQRDRQVRNKELALKMKELSKSSPLTTEQRHRMYKSKLSTLDKNAVRSQAQGSQSFSLPDATSQEPLTPMEMPEPEIYEDPTDGSQHLAQREGFVLATPTQRDPLLPTPRDPWVATPQSTLNDDHLSPTPRDAQRQTPRDVSSKRPRLMPIPPILLRKDKGEWSHSAPAPSPQASPAPASSMPASRSQFPRILEASSSMSSWRNKRASDILASGAPMKSKHLYEKTWNDFLEFINPDGATGKKGISEEPQEGDYVKFLHYLREGRKLKCSTIWSIFSRLNNTHQVRYIHTYGRI